MSKKRLVPYTPKGTSKDGKSYSVHPSNMPYQKEGEWVMGVFDDLYCNSQIVRLEYFVENKQHFIQVTYDKGVFYDMSQSEISKMIMTDLIAGLIKRDHPVPHNLIKKYVEDYT